METRRQSKNLSVQRALILSTVLFCAVPWQLSAQQHGAEHKQEQTADPASFEQRLSALQDKVALLETVLKRGHQAGQPPSAVAPTAMNMGGMKMEGMGEMGGMKMSGMGEMGGMGM